MDRLIQAARQALERAAKLKRVAVLADTDPLTPPAVPAARSYGSSAAT
ncbi:MAG: hypothetical protein ACJ74Z_05695 [Bryobacteraceae bacterium]